MAINVAGGELSFQATIDASQFRQQLNRIEADIRGFSGNIQKQSEQINTFAQRATTLAAGFFSTQAASAFIQSMVQVRGEFQQIEVSYRTMLGNKEQADRLMAETVKLAAITPFKLQDVAQGSKQLLAYGFAADKVTDTLQMLGDIASGVSVPLTDITYLYGTLQTQGRAYTRDIMQFTQRGIPILDELAKVLKKDKEEVMSMVEAGKVGFPEVEKAFQNLTGAGGKFFNLMAEQSKTLTGQLSNFQDALSRMLNEMGKSQEGVLSTFIQGATRLVDHYQEIGDIVKGLVVVYGSYRAALLAQAAATQIAALQAAGLTTNYILLAGAEKICAAAGRALNAVWAASPIIAMTGAIAGLAFAYVALTENTNALRAAQEKIADADREMISTSAQAKAQIETLNQTINSKTASLSQQEAAYKKLQGVTGGVLDSLTLEQYKLGDGVSALTNYIAELEKATRARVLFAEYGRKLEQLEKLKAGGIDEISTMDRLKAGFRNALTPTAQGISTKDWLKQLFNKEAAEKQIVKQKEKFYTDQIKSLKKAVGSEFDKLASEVGAGAKKTNDAVSKGSDHTLAAMEKHLADLQDARKQAIAGGKEFIAIEKQIEAQEREIAKYNNKREHTSRSIRNEAAKSERETNKAAEELKNDRIRFLQELDAEENRVFLAGLSRNKKEIEENRQKYQKMKDDARELGLGGGVVERINRAEKKTTGTIQYQQDTEALQAEVEKQKKIIDDFQKYQTGRGKEEAEARFGDQKDALQKYVDFLQDQIDKTTAGSKSFIGMPTAPEVQERLNFLYKALENAKEIALQIKNEELDEALKASQTYADKELEINKRYAEYAEAIRNDPKIRNKDERMNELKLQKEDELKQIREEARQKTAIYRLLNEDIYNYTVARAKREAALLERMLKNDHTLTVGMRREILSRIEMLHQLELEANKTFESMMNASRVLGQIAESFDALEGVLSGLAPALQDTIQTMGELAKVGKTAADAIAAFAQPGGGGILTGISLAIRAIGGLINIFKRAKESARKAREEIEAIHMRDFIAEFDVNQEFRERVRIQLRLNELRLSGIRKEKEGLQDQARQVKTDYDRVLAELYKQVGIIGQKTQKYGGFLGIGKKTRIVNLTESLAGKSYADLEKLFLSGKLEGKAKELFETLQRLKAEGADIDKMLADNQKEAMELFTGTTSDSLVDSIVEGFRNGKRAIVDFADDFQTLMENAVINALKYQVLEEPLQEFYKAFAAASQSGDVLTESEMKALQDQFNLIIEAAGARFEQLKQISGLNFDKLNPEPVKEEKKTGVAGAFAAASGEQIDALTGQFNGQRLATLELVQIGKASRTLMVDSLNVQVMIEANTRRSADYLRTVVANQDAHTLYLQSIDRKTGSTTATLAANGLG